VQIGDSGDISDDLKQKIISDAAGYIRTLAESHGRNADWAERAVREAVVATEQEAFELNVVDLVAPNLDSLLKQIDEREVMMLGGELITLNTHNANIVRVKMNIVENFLNAIVDPNIAILLLSLATLGIFVEITNPGLIFPGIFGFISGILAFYSLGQLPVNIAGVLLIVGAFGLFIAEVFTASFGLFTAGGIVSLVIGSIIMFKGGPFMINPWLIAGITIIVGATLAFVAYMVVRAHQRQAATGQEEVVGKTAVVKVPLEPQGVVHFLGENWTAVSEEGKLTVGEEVIITRVVGLKLYVKKSTGGS
jgi:membrane-bound serine protease (ClpP class)